MTGVITEVVHYIIAANDPIEDKSFSDAHLGFFGIYDGHGGVLCSDYLQRNFHLYLKEEFINNQNHHLSIEEKLSNTFKKVDNAFLNQMTSEVGNCMENCAGSCCLVTLITDVTIRVANVGDSRALLVSRKTENNSTSTSTDSTPTHSSTTPLPSPILSSYKITPLSFDHNATSSESERRLVAARTTDPNPVRVSDALRELREMQPDVVIDEADFPLRVAGTLMVTRAMGDAYLKRKENSYPPYDIYTPYITSEPEIVTHTIQPEDDFLIMASDGLWEILSNEEVVEIILDLRKRNFPGNIGEQLVRKLLERRAEQLQFPVEILRHLSPMVRRSVHDDITIYIVFLNPAAAAAAPTPTSEPTSTSTPTPTPPAAPETEPAPAAPETAAATPTPTGVVIAPITESSQTKPESET